MNSHERFAAVLRHGKPDRMPFYFPLVACSVASEILGRSVNTGGDSLQFAEGLAWLEGEQAHEEFVRKYHQDTVALHREMKADVIREVWRITDRPSRKIDDYTLLFGEEDGPHVIRRYFPETQSYGVVEDTAKPQTAEQIESMMQNEVDRGAIQSCEADWEETYRDQLQLKELADPYFPMIIPDGCFYFSMADPAWLEATALYPELIRDFYLCRAERFISRLPWLHKKGFRWINGGIDIAMQTGTVFSPASFREIFVPALQKLSEACIKLDMTYCYRSDGNLRPVSDLMFLDGKVQAIGETDRGAGMTVALLREKYPDLLILGNVDSSMLHQGTEDAVRRHVREGLMESGGKNYIAGPSNAIMPGTPIKNIFAMIEEIDEFIP